MPSRAVDSGRIEARLGNLRMLHCLALVRRALGLAEAAADWKWAGPTPRHLGSAFDQQWLMSGGW